MADDQPHINNPTLVLLHGLGQTAVQIRTLDNGARLEITKGPVLGTWLTDTTRIASPYVMGETTTIREANLFGFHKVLDQWLRGEEMDPMIEIPDDDRKLLTDTFGPEVAGGKEVKSVALPIHESHAADIGSAARFLAKNHHNFSGRCSTSGWRAYQTPDHWVIAVMGA